MDDPNVEFEEEPRQEEPQARTADKQTRLPLGAYLIIIGVAAAYVLCKAWPDVRPQGSGGGWASHISLFWIKFPVGPEARLIILAFAAGALGSCIQAAQSFIVFVGNRTFRSNWIWWYVMRPFIGAGLGLIFYLLFRGGLVTGVNGDPSTVINPYGIMAICGLAGLFSNKATIVLGRIFNAVFKTETEEDQEQTQLKDKLYPRKRPNPVPGIERWDPEALPAGEESAKLTVHGRNYIKGSVVMLDGSQTVTQFVNDKRLTAKLIASDLAAPGTVRLTVSNPEPGGGESKAVKLKIAKQ